MGCASSQETSDSGNKGNSNGPKNKPAKNKSKGKYTVELQYLR